jgi:hypothetical protein
MMGLLQNRREETQVLGKAKSSLEIGRISGNSKRRRRGPRMTRRAL